MESIFISVKADTDVVGNGGSYFRFINEDDLSDKLYQIEIDAEYTSEDGTSYDLFENYASFSPKIFIYEIKDTINYEIVDSIVYNVADLPSGSAQDSLDLPGPRGSILMYTSREAPRRSQTQSCGASSVDRDGSRSRPR